MKSNFSLLILISVLFTTGCYQSKRNDSRLNLSFEDVENGMPKGWYLFHQQPEYSVTLDSVHVKSGKYSIAIEFTGKTNDFQAVSFNLPYNDYDGKNITLSGYIKTENVTGSGAGLWMRIDPGIAFDNMIRNGRGITGTTDWNKYEVTLKMNPEQTQQIVIGGLLTGKGKIWLDDLKVTIDGKNISKATFYKSPFSENAEKDKEFDRGSNIVFPDLNEHKIEDLELLGKVWGFMKYHHPAIAKGNYNWDYELFRMLPDYLKTDNNRQRDELLIQWIDKYGRIPQCETCRATPDSAFIKPDLSWIDKSNINQKLKDLLHRIYLNRNQGVHYYIKMQSGVGNPKFTNENAYPYEETPDVGFRLLALFRYWNMINYFFPSKYLTDKDWNTILKEYIPLFIGAKDKKEYELTATRLIGEICDSHAYLMKDEGINAIGQVPVLVGFVENKLTVLKYYADKVEDAELKRGDVITHIDGKPVEAVVDSMKRYVPASNESARMRDIAREILRSKKNYLRVDYISSGKTKQKELYVGTRSNYIYYRYRKDIEDITQSYKFIGNDIGYITLANITASDIPNIKKEFMNTKGIIVDLRRYPFTDVVFSLAPFFVSKPRPFVKFSEGNIDNPGEFTFKGEEIIPKPVDAETYQGKLVVIVNENTQSAAEYHAMAFRAGDNTTIIGSQTAGADGNVSEIVLPGELKTRISGLGVYYPDGRATQRIGIVPDIEVKPTIKGITEGRDELLEKAIEIIKKESK